jgi:predicted lipoprotein with Yx(FWY)xxD motif
MWRRRWTMTNMAPAVGTKEVAVRHRPGSRWVPVTGVIALVAMILVPSGAWGQVASTKASKSVVVVQVATNATFGQILLTETNAPLYLDTTPPCDKSCRAIWPPLLMPKGKKTPLGVSGLSTMKFGHNLQVTYMGKALYTFTSDTGSTPTGNGVQGFAVATVGEPSVGGGGSGYGGY